MRNSSACGKQRSKAKSASWPWYAAIGLSAQLVDPKEPETLIKADSRKIKPALELHVATENYTDPLTKFDFLTYLKNSVFVTFMATLLTLVINSAAAFALSKYRFTGRAVVFGFIISTLMIPLSVVMVPAFLVVFGVGLTDNLWGVILPAVATPDRRIPAAPVHAHHSGRTDRSRTGGCRQRIPHLLAHHPAPHSSRAGRGSDLLRFMALE